jgi:hypothetical protein
MVFYLILNGKKLLRLFEVGRGPGGIPLLFLFYFGPLVKETLSQKYLIELRQYCWLFEILSK